MLCSGICEGMAIDSRTVIRRLWFKLATITRTGGSASQVTRQITTHLITRIQQCIHAPQHKRTSVQPEDVQDVTLIKNNPYLIKHFERRYIHAWYEAPIRQAALQLLKALLSTGGQLTPQTALFPGLSLLLLLLL
jgi:hypothetical protein